MTGQERSIRSAITSSSLPLVLAAGAAALLTSPAPAADGTAAAAKAEPCVACHGEGGVSQTEGVPSLAAQPDQYTQWQLVYFRSGTRKNDVMEQVAAPLSDADVRELGAYFAKLPAPQPAASSDAQPELTAKGAQLAPQHQCNSCHGGTYAGQQAVARLAGQREDYLLKALRDFKSGARSGGGVAAMPTTVYDLQDSDLVALAHYLARAR